MLIAETPGGWLIVLRPENLARMKHGDPATVPSLGLMICYEEISDAALKEKLQSPEAVKYLTRGWAEHPDDFEEIKLFTKSQAQS